MPFPAYRLLIVVFLASLGVGGFVFAGWWHGTQDLHRLDARAQALGWTLSDTPAAQDIIEPLLSAGQWRELSAPDADWSRPLAITVDDSAARTLDGSAGPLEPTLVHHAVEQTLLAVITGSISLDEGVQRALRLLLRCPVEAPGLDPLVQLVGSRLDALSAETRSHLARDLRTLAAHEAEALTAAMRATWTAVRAMPRVTTPSMISAQDWGLRLGREAYLDRFLAWGEQKPPITADLIQQLRQASATEVSLFGARAAWSRAGAAIQLHVTVDAVARSTLALALAAACDGGEMPVDRCDPTAPPLRQQTVGSRSRWYLVGVNGSDERGAGDDIALILPQVSTP